MAATAIHGLEMFVGDISNAFLQEGRDFVEKENIYAAAPKEVAELFKDHTGTANVLRTLRAFYGLTEAPRLFWLDVTRRLTEIGWRQPAGAS